MDYASLRHAGIRRLEELTGRRWTDLNAHDPGVMLLEQICYVLTDLSYRVAHPIPDLLADGGGDAYAGLHRPEEILVSNAVTLEDLRRLVLDVAGVRNAWVEPLRSGDDGAEGGAAGALWAGRAVSEAGGATFDLRIGGRPEGTDPVALRGLYRVLLDAAPNVSSQQIRAAVSARLGAQRGLCEDIADMAILAPQYIQVEASIEIDRVDDPAALHAEIMGRLAAEISPELSFATLPQLLNEGLALDEIFEGPFLQHGFLRRVDLERAGRKSAIYSSDLLRAIMNTPGVRSVGQLRMGLLTADSSRPGGSYQNWVLPVDAGRVARLAVDRESRARLQLCRAGRPIAPSHTLRRESGTERVQAAGNSAAHIDPPRVELPRGRNRQVGRYVSLQQELPAVYGVGDHGLPASAPLARHAQAKQLQAYLMFFDQLLANSYAQLAGSMRLLSHSAADRSDGQPSLATYFAGTFAPPSAPWTALCTLRADELQGLVEGAQAQAGGDDPLLRKHRFLNHLLARFAETPSERPDREPQAGVADKSYLLQNYPRLSRGRGTGVDLGTGGAETAAGVAELLRARLGLVQPASLKVVEHLLLRPGPEDMPPVNSNGDGNGDGNGEGEARPPWLAKARCADPYSLQLSVVLPRPQAGGLSPAALSEWQGWVEECVRGETPAHIAPYVCWLPDGLWAEFCAIYPVWLDLLRRSRRDREGGGADGADGAEERRLQALRLRGARDLIIDLLGLGQTAPLRDTPAIAIPDVVAVGERATIRIAPAQPGVRYQLYRGAQAVGAAVATPMGGDTVELSVQAVTQDAVYTVLAVKEHTGRAAVLGGSVQIRMGLDLKLPIEPAGVSVMDYRTPFAVRLPRTQPGVVYSLRGRTGSGAETELAKSDVCQGQAVELVTPPLTDDTLIRVHAQRHYDGATPADMADLLQASAQVFVCADRSVSVALAGIGTGPVVDYNAPATLLLGNTQPNVQYTVWRRPLSDADFLVDVAGAGGVAVTVGGMLRDGQAIPGLRPGSLTLRLRRPADQPRWTAPDARFQAIASGQGAGGSLRLSLGKQTQDAVLLIQAQKTHAGAVSAVPLVQPGYVLVRPDPTRALELLLKKGADGGATLRVHNGEPGVFYYFFAPGAAQPLCLPAYFHTLSDAEDGAVKGIGASRPADPLGKLDHSAGLAVDRDFVVIDGGGDWLEPGREDVKLPTPLLWIRQAPTGGTLRVQAVRARTGLGCSQPFDVKVTPA